MIHFDRGRSDRPSPARPEGLQLASQHLPEHLVRRALLAAPALTPADHARASCQWLDRWEVDLDVAALEGARRALGTRLAAWGWRLVHIQANRGEFDAVYHDEAGSALHVIMDREDVLAVVYAHELEHARTRIRQVHGFVLRHLTPRRRGPSVPVRLWSVGPQGPLSRLSTLDCPAWPDIAGNYPDVRAHLDWLMGLEHPQEAGRVVLWSGAPGTGKTWALRALLRAWRRVDVEIVSDPDAFLADPHWIEELVGDPERPLRERTALRERSARARLIVFEDAPELFWAEDGAIARSALAKLLSATDGLLAPRVPLVVLATTHEPVPLGDSALLRPGRCLQALRFGPLGPSEARAWLERHGAEDTRVARELTLAELYARLAPDGAPASQQRAAVGFAAGFSPSVSVHGAG